MTERYSGITADGLNKQYMLLVVQVGAQLATFQKATASLSNFELSYADGSKILMNEAVYKKAKKGLKRTIKESEKQLKRLSDEKRELVEYLRGVKQ